MKRYLENLLCDAAPGNGPAQNALEAAILSGALRLTCADRAADLVRCQVWLQRRKHQFQPPKPKCYAAA